MIICILQVKPEWTRRKTRLPFHEVSNTRKCPPAVHNICRLLGNELGHIHKIAESALVSPCTSSHPRYLWIRPDTSRGEWSGRQTCCCTWPTPMLLAHVDFRTRHDNNSEWISRPGFRCIVELAASPIRWLQNRYLPGTQSTKFKRYIICIFKKMVWLSIDEGSILSFSLNKKHP